MKNTRTLISFFLTLVLQLVLILAKPASAEDAPENSLHKDSLAALPDGYQLFIDRRQVNDMKLYDTLNVMLESYGKPIAGYDLKIATNSPHIDIVEVLPGEIHDSCDWDYFRAIQINTEDKPLYPRVVWQAVALAKYTQDSTDAPACFGFQRRASLIKLVVTNRPGDRVPDTTAAIFFFWETCSDNVLSDSTGSSMIISYQVFDYFWSEMFETDNVFPTRLGTPRQCLYPEVKNRPKRLIEFHNGGIKFKFDTERMLQSDTSNTAATGSTGSGEPCSDSLPIPPDN